MAFQLAPFLARSVPGVGVLGGIVGGAAALAATAFSAFAAGLVGGGLVVSLATAFTAAVAEKYVWDRGMDCLQEKYGETEV